MKNNIETLLDRYIGKKITLTYIIPNDTLRETSGILVSFNENIITIKLYNNYGEEELYSLNRMSCQIVSVIYSGDTK